MKKLYLLLIVFYFYNVNAQIINFPDAYFRQVLLNANSSNTIAKNLTGNWFKIDANNDQQIQITEALNVSYLNVNASYIESMIGISNFTNIKYLYCSSNHINALNLIGLTTLTDLGCSYNQLSSLDLANSTSLVNLQCNNNLLTTLNINGLTSLKNLDCMINLLQTLNVSGLTSLEILNCRSNMLTSLILSGTINLRNLNFGSNRLSLIDLAGLTNLLELHSGSNLLTSLNVNGLTSLRTLSCSYNQLTSLSINGLINLFDIHCYYNQITTLNLSSLPTLRILNCNNNQLPLLNVNDLSNLYSLDCSDNQLSTLDLTAQVQINNVKCSSNQLLSLNLNGLVNLQTLNCRANQLSTLNMNGLVTLSTLFCSENQLSSLDFTGLDIWFLYCSNNMLTTLNMSNELNLSALYCDNNLLTTLFIKNGKIEAEFNFYNNPNLQYICADDTQVIQVQNKITTYGYTNCHVNSYCSFTPGGTFYTFQGNNKYDENNNGCDISDISLANLKYTITNGTITGSLISNTTGNYSIPVQAGTHTITPVIENPTYFTISPTNVNVTFPTQVSPLTQNFCVTPDGTHPDLEITIIPIEIARPGFDAIYKLIYKNKGNTTQSGNVNLAFNDAVLDLVSATPVTTSQSFNNLSWAFTNLQPFEIREIIFTLNVNSPTETPAVNNGYILNYSATITSPAVDVLPNDNTFAYNQTVVNSYDPNDKTCLEGNTIPPNKVGDYVHYMIRFENNGTANAQNVVIKDMIDLNKFEINTLVPIKGSHDFVTNITAGNKVEFIFQNINLPFADATNDGYVAFKIKTKSNLVLGNMFSNSASIYFDYNFPIATNTATTTIAVLSKQDFEFSNFFTVYPSPVFDVLNISKKDTIEVTSINIYNTLGQLVLVIPNAQNTKTVDVSSLIMGNYFIKINSDKGTSNTKFIKN